jgi:hypothetical protein
MCKTPAPVRHFSDRWRRLDGATVRHPAKGTAQMPSPTITIRLPQDAINRLDQKAAELKLTVGEAAKLAVLAWAGYGADEAVESTAADEDAPGAVERPMVELAPFIAQREQVSIEQARRWIKQAFVRIDNGTIEGKVWKEPLIPAELKDSILVGKQLTQAERKRQRDLRAKRQDAAEKHGVAIGQIDEHGELMQGARELPPEVLAARKREAE